MNSHKELGMRLMAEAEKTLEWELKTSMEGKDWNLVVRPSQEVVELSLKGVLKLLGIDFPEVHDVGTIFSNGAKEKGASLSEDTLARIQQASKWLAEARALAFYAEKTYSKEDALRALEDIDLPQQEDDFLTLSHQHAILVKDQFIT